MSEIAQYRCDICQSEHREMNYWRIDLVQNKRATEDRYLYHVCNSCHSKIEELITGIEPAKEEKE